ncbi:MAG: DUF92 domain-containing protein [Acidobacteriota bacterium]
MRSPRTAEVSRLTATELLRKSVHIATGLLVVSLRWLDPLVLVPVAIAGLLFNSLVLPRHDGGWLWRPAEKAAGSAIGIVSYPLMVLVLLLVFRRQPEVIATAWGLLAFGDGAAAIGGQLWGGRRLPWNRRKSWSGLLSFWLVGASAVWCLVSWVTPGVDHGGYLVVCAAVTGLAAAFVESSSQRLDDNIAVPLISALVFLCLQQSEAGWTLLVSSESLAHLLTAVVVNAVFSVLGRVIGGLSPGGAVAASLIGTTILWLMGPAGYLCLLTFFLVGTLATRVGTKAKTALGVAEGHGGRRRAANAFANGGVASICALFAVVADDANLFVFAFVASLAAACADTVESEIGQAWGHPTLLITSFKPVEPGTDGGVSALGTLAGLGGALLISFEAVALDLFAWRAALPIALVALVATVLESLLGATIERRGLLNNQGVNFSNTLVAALLGAAVGSVVG